MVSECEWMTVAEAALVGGFSTKLVRRHIAEEKFHVINIGLGKVRPTYRINRKSFNAWLDSRRDKPARSYRSGHYGR